MDYLFDQLCVFASEFEGYICITASGIGCTYKKGRVCVHVHTCLFWAGVFAFVSAVPALYLGVCTYTCSLCILACVIIFAACVFGCG